ncbi:Tyrosine recombinase XerD [subsurface metagenome]
MKNLSPGSETLYRYWQGRFQDWLNGRPATVETGEAFLTALEGDGLKRNTLGCAARALRRIGLAVPAPSIEMGEPKYHSLDQVRRLIDTAPSLLEQTLITVCFSSACRISEVLGLMVDDLELDAGVATVTRKGGRRERVALGRQGTEALREWLAQRRSNSKRVFMDYTYQDIYRLFKALGKKAGIPEFTPHRLRHSRVMHLRQAGLQWDDISEICGHTKSDTTRKIYGRYYAEERAKLLVEF